MTRASCSGDAGIRMVELNCTGLGVVAACNNRRRESLPGHADSTGPEMLPPIKASMLSSANWPLKALNM